MKKSILILGIIFSIYMQTKAQQESLSTSLTVYNSVKPVSYPSPNHFGTDKDYDFYMQKSKNQRTIGWATLGGGFLLSGIGILVASSPNSNYNTGGKDYAPAILLGLGAVSGIVSIPFMIMASVNKNKAKVMLTNQKTGFGVPSNVSKDITGITFQLHIGK